MITPEQIAQLDGEVVIGTRPVEHGQHDFIRVRDLQAIIAGQQEQLRVAREALEKIKYALNNEPSFDALHTIGNEVSQALSLIGDTK